MSTVSISRSSLCEFLPRCRQAQAAWARLPLRDRLRPVRALRRLLVENADRLCAAVAQDIGKPVAETLAGDLLPLADGCRFLEREAARLLRSRKVARRHRPLWLFGQRDVVHRRPRGVVGVIGTWNYPIFLNGVQLVQALTAGNAVVWKPSEMAERSAALLCDVLGQAGYPPDLVQLLEATREAGSQLAQAEIDHVVFTGSATTGRQLARTLAERLVSSSLELSGCDAQFVLEDADIELAARAAWFGATLNRGQTCLAVRRAFVHVDQYGLFLDILRPLVRSARPVRLVMEREAQNARRLVGDALAAGARLLSDPPSSDGTSDLFTPAVVIDARPEMALCREASFAPILAVMPYATLEQALQANAHCPYGLGASIFTRDLERGQQLAARLRTGAVTINEVIVPTAHPATPLGGRGLSGWGVTQGAEGLLEMTVPQVVSVSSGSFRPHYDMDGTADAQETLARGLLEWGHGATWRQRWRGLKALVKGWWKN